MDNDRRKIRPRAGDSPLYFGSVRFFKNLIFIAVCVMILVPSLLAVKFYRQSIQPPPPEEAVPASADAPLTEENPEQLFEPEHTGTAARDGEAQPAHASDNGEAGSGEPAPAHEVPASADPPSYEALYPDFYAPQPYAATNRVENTIYITFDDGPSERTDELLKILAEKNVKATFFVVGQSDPTNLARMRKLVEAGHTIGMHSYSHDYAKVYSSVEGFLEEFYQIFTQIREATGVTPTVFRFPGGSINGYDGGFYQEIISEMIRRGFVPFDWNISSEDATTNGALPAEKLAKNVVEGAHGKVRGFVLFHDSSQKTTSPPAVAIAIDQLRDMGFEFAAITPDTLPVLYNYRH